MGEEVLILNVDESALDNPGKTGFGGLMRNHLGEFIQGYYGSAGVATILHAEICALYEGLKLCWEARVHCYSDSL